MKYLKYISYIVLWVIFILYLTKDSWADEYIDITSSLDDTNYTYTGLTIGYAANNINIYSTYDTEDDFVLGIKYKLNNRTKLAFKRENNNKNSVSITYKLLK